MIILPFGRRWRQIFQLLIGGLAWLAAAPTWTLNGAPVTGAVYSAAGAPIEFATVTLHRAADSTVVKTEFSDGQRAFRFERTLPGRYRVSAAQVVLCASGASPSSCRRGPGAAGLCPANQQTHATGRQVVQADNFQRDYYQLFPSAALKYTFSERNEVVLSLSRHINRPSHRQLNPFRYIIDPATSGKGNPNLRPETSYNAELNYTFKQKFTAGFSYSVT